MKKHEIKLNDIETRPIADRDMDAVRGGVSALRYEKRDDTLGGGDGPYAELVFVIDVLPQDNAESLAATPK